MRWIERIVVVLASVFFETQFILQVRSFRKRFHVVTNRESNYSFTVSFPTVVSIVGEQDDFNFASTFLLWALVQVVLIPNSSFTDSSVIPVVWRFFWKSLDVGVTKNVLNSEQNFFGNDFASLTDGVHWRKYKIDVLDRLKRLAIAYKLQHSYAGFHQAQFAGLWRPWLCLPRKHQFGPESHLCRATSSATLSKFCFLMLAAQKEPNRASREGK